MRNLNNWLSQQTSTKTGLEAHTDDVESEVDTTPLVEDENALTAFESFQSTVEHLQGLHGDLGMELYRIEQLQTLWSSMESSLVDGGMTPAMGRMIQGSLEQLQETTETLPSVEDFGPQAARRTHTQIAMEATNATMDKVIARVKEILRKLADYLREAWTHLTNGVGRAEKRLDDLTKRVDALPSNNGKIEVKISGLKRMSAAGQFIGLDSSAVKEASDTTQWLFDTYPKEITSFMKAVTKEFDKVNAVFNSQSDIPDLMENMVKLIGNTKLTPVPGEQNVQNTQLSGHAGKATNVKRGYTLADNRSVVRYSNRIAPNEDGSSPSLFVFTRTFGIEFQRIEKLTEQKEDSTTVSPDRATLKKMTEGLKTWLAVLKKARESDKVFTDARNEILRISNERDLGFFNSSNGQAAMVGISGALGQCQQPVTTFIGYAVATINAHLAVLEHCIKAHEKGGDKTQTQRPGTAVATT